MNAFFILYFTMLDSITITAFNKYYGKQKQQMLRIRPLNRLIKFPTSLSRRHLEAGLATLQGVKPQGVWINSGEGRGLKKGDRQWTSSGTNLAHRCLGLM